MNVQQLKLKNDSATRTAMAAEYEKLQQKRREVVVEPQEKARLRIKG